MTVAGKLRHLNINSTRGLRYFNIDRFGRGVETFKHVIRLAVGVEAFMFDRGVEAFNMFGNRDEAFKHKYVWQGGRDI